MNHKALAFAVLASAISAQYANAADGTINFTGELTATTCTPAVNGAGGATAASVTLPTASASSLQTAGLTAGQTTFNISLSGCSGTAKTAAAYFESGAGVDPASGQLRNTGTAGNVRLQLVDAGNDKPIRAGNSEQRTTAFGTPITYGTAPGTGTPATPGSAGTATLPYAVRYISTGAATAGTVIGSVTYSLTYQ